ncbi:SipW-dependent-type signal peptide-containing protein [Microbacterium sp. 179-I 3D3 NHS]|uniref:SipW-dependent-type signal peptide-containing protein n=1 Tax=Microbacterium sp. 179-I 3D3 NHS TaxID=3142382 RepID=UPI00399F9643
MAERRGGVRRRTRVFAALGAGIAVLGVGATYTLASWNDSEWVWAGADGAPSIATSSFEVQQNTSMPFADGADEWLDAESNAGGSLVFSVGSLALSPGDTVYAPVALRTTDDSLAAAVTLQGAVTAEGSPTPRNDQALFDAVRVSVFTVASEAPATPCTSGFSAAGWETLLEGRPLTATAAVTQSLQAAAGSTQHYCFALSLPASTPDVDTLQGLAISPAWEFRSVSVTPQ